VRLIRINFPDAGRITSLRRGGLSPSRKEGRFPLVEPDVPRTCADTRSLERKVAKVASRKCTVKEVSILHNELRDWLTHDETSHDQVISLLLNGCRSSNLECSFLLYPYVLRYSERF